MMAENIEAWNLWTDTNLLGVEFSVGLRNLELNDFERGDLLVKLRILASEAARIQGEKMKQKQGD